MSAAQSSAEIFVAGFGEGTALQQLMNCDQILPGDSPSYSACKAVLVYHPLGAKMVEAPIVMAQSQSREIVVGEGAPEEVARRFEEQWLEDHCDDHLFNVHASARTFGISTLIANIVGQPTKTPFDMPKIAGADLYFSVWDPLNTAGSLTSNQNPLAPDFNKPMGPVRCGDQVFHASKSRIVLNGRPVYLEWTGSAFGFVGRSVYQSAFYALQSFLKSMLTDDVIVTKNGLLVAKMKQPTTVVDNIVSAVLGIKRAILKGAHVGQVLGIGQDDSIETLDMTNVQQSGEFARNNILKNIATAADMPASLLDNETLVGGFGEGTEDAKNIARYIDRIRAKMRRDYQWMDNLIQYRAWDRNFYERLKKKQPKYISGRSYEDMFSEWRDSFSAVWPNWLIEPESERAAMEKVKLEAIVAIVQTLAPMCDAANKVKLVEWVSDNLGEYKLLFQHALDIDPVGLEAFLEDEEQRGIDAQQVSSDEANAAKFGKFDAATRAQNALQRMTDMLKTLGPKAALRKIDKFTRRLPRAA